MIFMVDSVLKRVRALMITVGIASSIRCSFNQYIRSNHQFVRLFSSSPQNNEYDISACAKQLNLSDSQVTSLHHLQRLLISWNTNVNLVSRKDVEALIPNHILPSLAVHAARKIQPGERHVDVGTGGGLPGLPMAIANPQAHFTLLDSNSKKMLVVRDIVERLQLSNVNVICGRAEDHYGHYDFIMGRAVSALPNFLSYSSHLLDHSGTGANKRSSLDTTKSGMLYLKGGDFLNEIIEAEIDPSSVTLISVSSLLPGLSSEKFVLYIPHEQIALFYRRFNTKNASNRLAKKK